MQPCTVLLGLSSDRVPSRDSLVRQLKTHSSITVTSALTDKSLKRNMCSIPEYALNSDVDDLPERVEKSGIHGALEYACRSWYRHLIRTKALTTDVVSALHFFLKEKFNIWLEALSVLGAVGEAAHASNITVKWLNEVCPDL